MQAACTHVLLDLVRNTITQQNKRLHKLQSASRTQSAHVHRERPPTLPDLPDLADLRNLAKACRSTRIVVCTYMRLLPPGILASRWENTHITGKMRTF